MPETTIIPPWHTPKKPGIYAPTYPEVPPEHVSPLVYVEVKQSPAAATSKGLLRLFTRVFFGIFGGLMFFFVGSLLLAWAFVP